MRGGVLADLPFPPGCVSCGAPGFPWCPGCERRVEVLLPPGCRRCGRPALRDLARCADCPAPEIASLRAPFRFEGPVRDALLKLKFTGMRSVGAALGRAMAEVWDGPALPLTWVPLSRRRLARRGYDQAEALARAAAEGLGVAVGARLQRTVDLPSMARRGRRDRLGALRGAFRAVGPVPPSVVLVDDVVTTGSTVTECARVLRAAGAREVHVLAAARALSGPLPNR
ncbi:MAG: double zinc ribbon domain-containing protein [Actinomycetota bacterium]